MASGLAADVFTYGKHGSTFGGNPLATAAGLATLNIIEKEAESFFRFELRKICSFLKKIGESSFYIHLSIC